MAKASYALLFMPDAYTMPIIIYVNKLNNISRASIEIPLRVASTYIEL